MKYKIVIAEDEPDIGRLAQFKLKRAGFDVYWELDGKSALFTIMRLKPDLVILDINMPEKNGYEVFEDMKNNDALKEIPVVFLTALGQQKDVVKGIKLGVNDYIVKPFQPNELVKRVNSILEKNGLGIEEETGNEEGETPAEENL